MKREINMKKTLLFSTVVLAALALCSCGSAKHPLPLGLLTLQRLLLLPWMRLQSV